MLRTRLAAAVAVAALSVIGLAAPAHATPAQGTVSFSGDAGDYITQGQSYSYTAPDDRIDLQGNASHVTVGIMGCALDPKPRDRSSACPRVGALDDSASTPT